MDTAIGTMALARDDQVHHEPEIMAKTPLKPQQLHQMSNLWLAQWGALKDS